MPPSSTLRSYCCYGSSAQAGRSEGARSPFGCGQHGLPKNLISWSFNICQFYLTIFTFYLIIFFLLTESVICVAQESSIGSLFSLSDSAFGSYTLDADNVQYDLANGIIEANGNVKMNTGKFNITADSVLYHKKQQLIQARGKLVITDNKGDEFLADFIELNKTNNTSRILKVRARIHNQNNDFLISTKEIGINNNSLYTMQDFTFTPCKVCSNNFVPNIPLWQIKGKSAVMDIESGTIRYVNARIEFFGIPIFYAPYLSMPSHGVRRKSGVLIPKISFSDTLGFRISIPYYFNIAPNKDATVNITTATKDKILYQGEFRHLLQAGRYFIKGSFTNYDNAVSSELDDKTLSYRGYIEALGEFSYKKLRSDHLYGFEINMLFDKYKTYLKRYDVKDDDILINDLYWHKLSNDGSLSLRGLLFEDLRHGASQYSLINPIVAPLAAVTHSFRLSENFNMNFAGHAANFLQDPDLSYHKLSLSNAIEFKKKLGDYFIKSSLSLRGDFYHLQQKDYENKYNISQEALLELRRKFWYSLDSIDFSFEPVGQLILSPRNNIYVPGEKREPIDVNSNNIFSHNHYYDMDQIEVGNRINFGVRGNIMGKYFSQASFFFGGNYNTKINKEIPGTSRSYISNINFQLTDNAIISNRSWIGMKDLEMIRNEFDASLNYDKWILNCTYVTNDKRYIPLTYPQEINVNLWYNVYSPWWINIFERRKLGSGGAKDESHVIENGAGVKYKDECIEVIFGIKRSYLKLGDIEPSTSFNLSVHAPF